MPYDDEDARIAEQLFEDVLRSDFALFDESHAVGAQHICDGGRLWIAYSEYGFRGSERFAGTSVDANVEGSVCYVPHIQRSEEHRGEGYGRQLYLCLEKAVRQLGCTKMILNPSGRNRDKFWESLGFRKQGVNYEKQL